jgi:protein-S-isoprenylcysteine O-methyltransferase Ste14
VELADPLKLAAYCAYLAAWAAFAIAAILGALPKLRQPAAESPSTFRLPIVIGTLLQAASAIITTRLMDRGPLHPRPWELAGTLLLAPLGAALFVWAVRSTPKNDHDDTLVTTGAYQWLRHPIYLAFLALLLATGFLVSGGTKLILPLLLYLAGSELRIVTEESDLARKYPDAFVRYRNQTRWRYLPGLR